MRFGHGVLRGRHSTAIGEKGDKKESRAAAEKAIEKEPGLLAAHWHLTGLALEAKDWADVRKGLERVEAQGVPIGDLTTVPDYAEFVKSPEHAARLKAREAKQKKDEKGAKDGE